MVKDTYQYFSIPNMSLDVVDAHLLSVDESIASFAAGNLRGGNHHTLNHTPSSSPDRVLTL